jgi:hypothetical protein
VSIVDLWPSIRPSNVSERVGVETIIFKDGVPLRAPYNGGWVNLVDSEYPGVGEDEETGREAIDADETVQYTVDGLDPATNVEYCGCLGPNVWQDSVFSPAAIGDTYMIRLTFTASSLTSATGQFLNVTLGIGADYETVVADVSVALNKGQDVDTLVSVVLPIFCLDTFCLQGGKFFITPSNDIEIWNKAIFIQRTYHP